MPDYHHVRIYTDQDSVAGKSYHVEIDGKELYGVTSITFSASMREASKITLEMYAIADIGGIAEVEEE